MRGALRSVALLGAGLWLGGCYLSHERMLPSELPDGGVVLRDVTCSGNGRIHTVSDPCLDDSGSSALDDNLEIYCCDGLVRLCLSGEACPWRSGCSAPGAATCSLAGLREERMATVRCERFREFTGYYCSSSGVAFFTTE